jgi:protein transport protein SEC61 subunit gamma and related proteins
MKRPSAPKHGLRGAARRDEWRRYAQRAWLAVLNQRGVQRATAPIAAFYADSYRLLRRCVKPDRREFVSVVQRMGLGFLGAGLLGFFVKLVFIPIRTLVR